MTFLQILSDIRKKAFSEKDKGFRFEKLMRAYLLTDPLYATTLKTVWLWSDFPFRKDFSGKDTGIDLVALTTAGDYWAIQCKCYDEDTYIDKGGVDSFLSTSSKQFQNDELRKVRFTHRLWIATTNKWSSEANKVLVNQDPPVSRISLTDLINAPVDWDLLVENTIGEKPRYVSSSATRPIQSARNPPTTTRRTKATPVLKNVLNRLMLPLVKQPTKILFMIPTSKLFAGHRIDSTRRAVSSPLFQTAHGSMVIQWWDFAKPSKKSFPLFTFSICAATVAPVANYVSVKAVAFLDLVVAPRLPLRF